MNQYIQFMKSFIARIYMVLALAVCLVGNLLEPPIILREVSLPAPPPTGTPTERGGGSSPSGFDYCQ